MHQNDSIIKSSGTPCIDLERALERKRERESEKEREAPSIVDALLTAQLGNARG